MHIVQNSVDPGRGPFAFVSALSSRSSRGVCGPVFVCDCVYGFKVPCKRACRDRFDLKSFTALKIGSQALSHSHQRTFYLPQGHTVGLRPTCGGAFTFARSTYVPAAERYECIYVALTRVKACCVCVSGPVSCEKSCVFSEYGKEHRMNHTRYGFTSRVLDRFDAVERASTRTPPT